MATYPGMNLRGEVRESVSLDEDDLSDVEDEVFIRDGKNGYKYEDISVKKPLMAPRRKPIKSSFVARTRYKSACRHWCKPLCYALIALSILIGLIVGVIVVVSFFPLPLDKLRHWMISDRNSTQNSPKSLPCTDLKVTNVWTLNFPKIISESPVRIVDVNQDGIEDVIFGFGTSDENLLPADLFCPMYMGVSPPCQGGVMALNGINGSVIWKHWLPNSVFTLLCTIDINLDNVTDCLVTGRGGIFLMLNMKDGTEIWQFSDKSQQNLLLIDIYSANFIADQDGDGFSDIVAAHTSQKGRARSGHLLIISGKTGNELQRVSTPNDVETYFTPQVLAKENGTLAILFGTGSPTLPGNLSVIDLKDLLAGNMTFQTIYRDTDKGILTPTILVDITGDAILDIIFAAFNSTVVAINGKNYQQIWNFTIANSETLSVPVPGYFNNDNITDFLVKYQTGPNFPTYYYSQTFILDGKTGKPIYKNPIIDSVGSQMGGISIGMEGFGFDFLTFWVANCKDHERTQEVFEFIPGSNIHERSRADICKLRVNSTLTAKLFALNEFDQPPGIEIYNSENVKMVEYNDTKSTLEEAASYIREHPEIAQTSLGTDNSDEPRTKTFPNVKYYDGSSFRHKDNGQGLIKDFSKSTKPKIPPKYKVDYDPNEGWQSHIPQYDMEADYNNYLDEADPGTMYNNNNKLLVNENNRDPRSKMDSKKDETLPNKKKDLSGDKYGIYDYRNIHDARDRLMHDLDTPPNEILRDTYFKKREMQLQNSKMEERDLESHPDQAEDEIRKALEKEKIESYNQSMSLWDLESEKEIEENEKESWRKKREVNLSTKGVPRMTSVGTILQSLNATTNSIDLLLITYWLPPKENVLILIQKDFDCINEKLKQSNKAQTSSYDKKTLEETYMKECLEERGVQYNPHNHQDSNIDPTLKNFPYYHKISHLAMGQLTVYRLRLECVCQAKKGEKCVRFLDRNYQSWPEYLGQNGDGIFRTRN